MKKTVLCLSLSVFAFPLSARAEEAAAVPVRADVVVAAPVPQNCKLIETVQFGVNFNNVNVEPKTAKTFMDDKIADLRNIAKDVGIESLEIQNLNYSVYNNNYNYAYTSYGSTPAALPTVMQLNGNVSFIVQDSAKGTALMEKAGEKGYNVNFNLSAYRQCQ